MSWHDKYLQASFRNVIFFVPSVDNSGGRRIVTHQFPGQDTPYSEDMGRSIRGYTFEAYVLGDNYFAQRDALLDALEKPGPGKLIHPYRGTLTVVVNNYTMRETDREGRMARFTINFTEAGELIMPSAVVDTQATVLADRGTALDAAKAALESAYNILSVPHSIAQNVIANINTALELVDEVKKSVGAIAEFQRDLESIVGKVIQLAYDVVELAENLTDIITWGTDIDNDSINALDTAGEQFEEMMQLDAQVGAESTAPLSPEDPSILVIALIRQAAVISASGLLSIISFKSSDEAEEMGNRVLTRIDELSEEVLDDALYTSLVNLRKSVAADIKLRSLLLPEVIQYPVPGTTSSLALSWLLYGDILSESDIIDRNNIENPGIIASQRILEVLSDAS